MTKKFAIVNSNNISNVAVWDGTTPWTPVCDSKIDVTFSGHKVGQVPPVSPIASINPTSAGVVWLDASDATTMTLTGTRLDEWRDKNASGVKFVTTAAGVGSNPTYDSALYGNRGGVSFNNKLLESFATTFPMNWTGYTAFMVINKTSRDGQFFASSVGQIPFLGSFNGERVGLGSQGGIPFAIPRNEACVIGTVNTASTTAWKFIIDEQLHQSMSGSSISVFSGDLPKVQIGGSTGSPSNGIFTTASYVFVNRVLTDDEVRGMSQWLKSYYGIAPLSKPSWNVVIDGNSLSWGLSGVTQTALYDGVLEANGAPSAKDIEIRGWTGQHTQALATRGFNWIDTRFNPLIDPKKRICIFWEGTNDFSVNNVTDVQCYANIKAYCKARKQFGWKVVVATILPMKTPVNANFEVYRLSVNAMIRTAKTNNEDWLDAVADIANDSILGLQATASNTTYYTDGTHLTTLGHSIAKTYVTAAINAITGL